MTLNANGYPTTPLSTAVPADTNSTVAAEVASFQAYNNQEMEVISIAKGRTPFLFTLVNLGRGLNGGEYSKMGFNEQISKNFPEFKWKERGESAVSYTVNGAFASGVTTLVFDSTSGLYAGLTMRNVTTNEQIRITSITNSTTLVAQRAVGTVAAAAIADNAVFQVIASASTKGQASMGSFSFANADRSNYFQKFLTTMTETDFDMFGFQIGGAQKLVAEKTVQHAIEIERAALFGQKGSFTDPATGQPFYTMEGVIENCKRGWTNDISASLTRITLEEALINPLKYSKDGNYRKIVLCGSGVIGRVSNLFEGRLQVNQIKDIDLTFKSIRINQGDFTFVEHPFLDAGSGYEGVMFIIDPAFCRVIYPSGEDKIKNAGMNGKTRFELNHSVNTFASTEASLVTYMTMECANSNAFAAIKIM